MPEYTLERGMPSAPDAEKSILGSILLDVNALYEAQQTLRSDDFSVDAHRRIFQRMIELAEQGKPVDRITLPECLSVHKELEAVGGVSYVSSLPDGVPRRPSIKHHADIVKDKSVLRNLIHAASAAIERAAAQEEKADEVLGGLEDSLLELRATGRQFSTFKDLMQKCITKIRYLRTVETATLGLPTGIGPIDSITTGIRESELWIIGGRPNVGKTPLGCQIAMHNVMQGIPVALFSLEMDEEKTGMRYMAHMGAASARKIRDPRIMDDVEALRAMEIAANNSEWPLYVDDTPGLSLSQLRAKARLAIHKFGARLIVIDYLQLIDAPGKDAYTRVSNVARGLYQLKRETKVPVVALSQLNRNAKEPSKAPTMGDLRESGVIEQEADVIALVHRPPEGDDPNVLSCFGELILAKVREGERGPENVEFDRKTLTFKARQP
jgi:replicative DNA helicase